MLRPLRSAAFLAVSALLAGTAFAATPAERDEAVPTPEPAPAPSPTPLAEPVPALDAPVPAPPSEMPAPADLPAGEPAGESPAPVDHSAGIVRPGTAEEGCFADKEEYLDVWHHTGVAPDPCFIPPV